MLKGKKTTFLIGLLVGIFVVALIAMYFIKDFFYEVIPTKDVEFVDTK